jgi:hypothetical protein
LQSWFAHAHKYDTARQKMRDDEIRMLELKNLAKYKRYLLEETNLLVVQGSINPVIAGMDVYNSRYQIAPPNEILRPSIQELLAATALSAIALSERESWGWSLTFKGSNAGFFVGIEPEGMICIRALEADPEIASGMIQRQKAGLPMTQSHILPRTQNPRDTIEQYFAEVEQTKTRLAIKEDGAGILVQSLPGGNFDDIKDLPIDKLFEFIAKAIGSGQVKELGEVLMFYECRCSEAMISKMIDNMTELDRRDMFGNLQQLEIECPRCGRKYTIAKTEESVH